MTYEFYRAPRPEQARGFELAKDAEYWFHNWDPRVGKTKVVNDTFAYNYALGRVTAMVVIAYPATVHRVWQDEAPKDFSPEFLENTKLVVWEPGKMNSKARQLQLRDLLEHDGPVILTMNCEAILTPTGYNFLRKLFTKHRVLLVVDEDWATRWSARTKRLLAMGRAKTAVMRRLLSGTPAAEGPDNLYYPTTFLKPGCLGFTSMTAFRSRYTEYETEESAPGIFTRKKGYNRRTNTEYDIFKGYQNLEELSAKLAKFSDRAVRQGSNKAYATRYFTLTEKQRRVYDKLKTEYVAELSTGPVPILNVLTRMTRLQSIARNFYPPERTGAECPNCNGAGNDGPDDCPVCDGLGYVVKMTELERIDERNPALEALLDELQLSRRPFLIWCRFIPEVRDVLAATTVAGYRVARYDGTMPAREREAGYHGFNAGEYDGIVATERSGLSRGHDLRRAKLMVYFSNEWSLRDRQQSEDRAESTDVDAWTDIVDLVATDTRDLEVIEALRNKRSLAELIMGDKPTRWL